MKPLIFYKLLTNSLIYLIAAFKIIVIMIL